MSLWDIDRVVGKLPTKTYRTVSSYETETVSIGARRKKYIEDRLCEMLVNYDRYKRCENGIVDVITEDAIYVIASKREYTKADMDKLLYLSDCFPDKNKVLVITGKKSQGNVERKAEESGIKIVNIDISDFYYTGGDEEYD